MIPLRSCPTISRSTRSRWAALAIGGLASAAAGGAVRAGDLVQVTDRCAVYGAGYVDLGNGTCGQVSRRIESQQSGWTGGNAGLRSDGYGMMPGAGNARHLRIQVDPDVR